jgi:hypothetical protein
MYQPSAVLLAAVVEQAELWLEQHAERETAEPLDGPAVPKTSA